MDRCNHQTYLLFYAAFNFFFVIVTSRSYAELPRDHRFHPNVRLLPLYCGHQVSTDRIHNGIETEMYEVPWMAALRMVTGRFDCGGSLITRRFVLTAAHCVFQNDIVSIRLGQHDFTKDPECDIYEGGQIVCAPHYQDFQIAKIIVHRGFVYNTLLNDIALVKLKTRAKMNAAVSPICLPITLAEKLNHIRMFTVVGWGLTETKRKSTVLMKAEVPIQKLRKCPGIRKRYGQLCLGGVNATDACYGDSGAPLTAAFVSNEKLKMIQYGLVSNGALFCGENGKATTYTNVAAYVGWILDHLTR